MPTMKEKVDHLCDSAVEAIRKRQEYGEAPILMVFSNPEISEQCHAIAAGGLDAQQLIKDLADSKYGRIH